VTPRAFWDRFGDLWELDPAGRNCRLVWASGEYGPRTFSGGWVPLWYARPLLAPLIPTA
jgi:hypothetical protein